MERISKSKVNLLATLSKKKFRLKEGLFIAEGWKSVSDLLNSRYEVAYIVGTSEWYEKHRDNLPSGVIFYESTEGDLKKISSLTTAAPVIGVFRLSEDEKDLNLDTESIVLLLDGIQDPGNLGTIIRTVDWFGIRKIFASQDTVDVYNPKTIMATMGSLSRVEVVYTDLKGLIESHPELPVYGTLLSGKNIYSSDLRKKGFIVMGNEGNGISECIKGKVTDALTVPPVDNVSHPDSLNVGTATAIVLSEFFRNELQTY